MSNLTKSLITLIIFFSLLICLHTIRDNPCKVFKVLLASIFILIVSIENFKLCFYTTCASESYIAYNTWHWTWFIISALLMIVLPLLSSITLYIKYKDGYFVFRPDYSNSCQAFTNTSFLLCFILCLKSF